MDSTFCARTAGRRNALVFAGALALVAFTANRLPADDTLGPIVLSPVSGPKMVLEAVDAGTTDGTAIALNTPVLDAKQKWVLVSKGFDTYVIRPSYTKTLVLTVKDAATANDATIDLETDAGKPNQLWSFVKNDNGTVSLIPQFASTKALNDAGFGKTPGSRQDLWDFNPSDPYQNEEWNVSGVDGAKVPDDAQTTTGAATPDSSSGSKPPTPSASSSPNPGPQ